MKEEYRSQGIEWFLSEDYKVKKEALIKVNPDSMVLYFLGKDGWETYAGKLAKFHRGINLDPTCDFCKQFQLLVDAIGIQQSSAGGIIFDENVVGADGNPTNTPIVSACST